MEHVATNVQANGTQHHVEIVKTEPHLSAEGALSSANDDQDGQGDSQAEDNAAWSTGGWLDEETGAGWGEEGGVQGEGDNDLSEETRPPTLEVSVAQATLVPNLPQMDTDPARQDQQVVSKERVSRFSRPSSFERPARPPTGLQPGGTAPRNHMQGRRGRGGRHGFAMRSSGPPRGPRDYGLAPGENRFTALPAPDFRPLQAPNSYITAPLGPAALPPQGTTQQRPAYGPPAGPTQPPVSRPYIQFPPRTQFDTRRPPYPPPAAAATPAYPPYDPYRPPLAPTQPPYSGPPGTEPANFHPPLAAYGRPAVPQLHAPVPPTIPHTHMPPYFQSSLQPPPGLGLQPPTTASPFRGMPPIQSFQKFMLEQTDEPSPEESLQRYAEAKFHYIEDYTKMMFEIHREQQWFIERYLPSTKQQTFNAKKIWAKEEAGRFKRQLLHHPDLFVISASLEPTVDLEYHALINKYQRDGSVPPAADQPDRLAMNGITIDTSSQGNEVSITSLDARAFEGHTQYYLCIHKVPAHIPRASFAEAIRLKGGLYNRILFSDPSKVMHLDTRDVWVVYSTKEAAEAARQALQSVELEHPQEAAIRAGMPPPLDYFKPIPVYAIVHNVRKIVQAPAEMSNPRRLERDVADSMAVAVALDAECALNTEGQGLEAMLQDTAVVAELGRRNASYRLDLIMAYLRRVHFVVYYGGDEFQDEGDLIFSAGYLYKRADAYRRPSGPEGLQLVLEPKLSDWTIQMDEKIARLREKLSQGRAAELEKAVEEQTTEEDKIKDKWLADHMGNEGEGRWRCAAPGCAKLFKSSDFLSKHLLSKHANSLEEALTKIRAAVIKRGFDDDQDKPLPPVQVDKGSGQLKAISVGEVLAEVAAVLGKDMSQWKQMIEDGQRRRDRGIRRGVRRLPPPVLGPLSRTGAAINTEGLMAAGPARRGRYKDIDVPQSPLVTVDYGDIAVPPPPKRRRKKGPSIAAASSAPPTVIDVSATSSIKAEVVSLSE